MSFYSDAGLSQQAVGKFRNREMLHIAWLISLSIRGGHHRDSARRALPEATIAVGEMALTGELRSVPRLAQRLGEAERLGFRRAIVPAASLKKRAPKLKSMELMSFGHVAQAIEQVL